MSSSHAEIAEIEDLLVSPDETLRRLGYRRATSVAPAALPAMSAKLDSLPPPPDTREADVYWETSNILARACLLASPEPASEHVAAMDEPRRRAVTELFLARPCASPRELEFLDALLAAWVAQDGLVVLERSFAPEVRARVYAHLIELETSCGVLGGPAVQRLADEPRDVVERAHALVQARALASLTTIVEDVPALVPEVEVDLSGLDEPSWLSRAVARVRRWLRGVA